MLHTRGVVGHTLLLGYLHGIRRVHPSHHEIGREGSRGVGIACEGDISGTGGLQLRQGELDILSRTHHLGDGADVARVLGPHTGEAIVGTLFYLPVGKGDTRAQVHVQRLGMQTLAPLQEQAHGIALHRETGAHQGARRILNGGRAVAHAHRDVVERRVDIDGLALRGPCGEAACHGSLVKRIDSTGHRLAVGFGVKRQQSVGHYLVRYAGDGAGQTHLLRIEIGVGRIAEREEQAGGQLVGHLFESRQHLIAAEAQHGGEETAREESRPLLEQGQRLRGIVLGAGLVHPSLPGGIALLIKHIQQLCQTTETAFTRILAQAEGPYHAHPHAPLGVHVLGGLRSAHRQAVEPLGHPQARLSVVLQHQLHLHFDERLRTHVERSPHVVIEFVGMKHERLGLYNLHITRLLVPQVAEHVGGRLQQGPRLFVPTLLHQLLHHQHGGLLHRDGDGFGQRQLTEQQAERVFLRAVERSGRCEQ